MNTTLCEKQYFISIFSKKQLQFSVQCLSLFCWRQDGGILQRQLPRLPVCLPLARLFKSANLAITRTLHIMWSKSFLSTWPHPHTETPCIVCTKCSLFCQKHESNRLSHTLTLHFFWKLPMCSCIITDHDLVSLVPLSLHKVQQGLLSPNVMRKGFSIHKLFHWGVFMWDVWRVESRHGRGKYRITTFHWIRAYSAPLLSSKMRAFR